MTHFAKAPELMTSVLARNQAVETCGLEKSLLHLIRRRASRINGCSCCVEMHAHEALEDGDSLQRVLLVAASRESPLFTEGERMAFAWTEAVTRVADGGLPDALYAAALAPFSESELVKQTVAVSIISTCNRLSLAFHALHPIRG